MMKVFRHLALILHKFVMHVFVYWK